MKKAFLGLLVLVCAVFFGFVFMACPTSTGGGDGGDGVSVPPTTDGGAGEIFGVSYIKSANERGQHYLIATDDLDNAFDVAKAKFDTHFNSSTTINNNLQLYVSSSISRNSNNWVIFEKEEDGDGYYRLIKNKNGVKSGVSWEESGYVPPTTTKFEGTWKNTETYNGGSLGTITSNTFKFDGNNWQQLLTGNNYGKVNLFVDYKGTFTFTDTEIVTTYTYYSEDHGTSWKELATSQKQIYQYMSGATGSYPYEIDDMQTPNILQAWQSASQKDQGVKPEEFKKQ